MRLANSDSSNFYNLVTTGGTASERNAYDEGRSWRSELLKNYSFNWRFSRALSSRRTPRLKRF
jgi:hypothetical protein